MSDKDKDDFLVPRKSQLFQMPTTFAILQIIKSQINQTAKLPALPIILAWLLGSANTTPR
jgi:hypothetical protein